MPLIHTGNVGFREGKYMASTDELYITVKGKGGHGAMPQFAIDPIVIASHIIIALQQVISRIGDTRIPSVLTIGKIQALGATNVIPSEAQLEGTFRTLDEEWRAKAHQKIAQIAKGIAESFGAEAIVRIEKGYPYLENNPELTRTCRAAAETYLGQTHVEDLDVWMAAEDFSYYTHQVPGTFYRLGVRNESKGIIHSVHHPQFNIDEEALALAPGLMAFLALEAL
jgi:amidohydrolase